MWIEWKQIGNTIYHQYTFILEMAKQIYIIEMCKSFDNAYDTTKYFFILNMSELTQC